jgi:hypothetical protein
MDSHSQTLVYALIAPLLPRTDVSIEDADLLDELGLDALDLALVAIKLQDLEPDRGAFPLSTLALARSVGDLVVIVDVWLHDEAPSSQGRSL